MFKLMLINLKHSLKSFIKKDEALRKEMVAYNKAARKNKTGKFCYMETQHGYGVKLHQYIDYAGGNVKMKPGKIYKQKFANGRETWTIQM